MVTRKGYNLCFSPVMVDRLKEIARRMAFETGKDVGYGDLIRAAVLEKYPDVRSAVETADVAAKQ